MWLDRCFDGNLWIGFDGILVVWFGRLWKFVKLLMLRVELVLKYGEEKC